MLPDSCIILYLYSLLKSMYAFAFKMDDLKYKVQCVCSGSKKCKITCNV